MPEKHLTRCSAFPSNTRVKLPTRLAEARKKAKRTQADIAKILDVSLGTVGGWESSDEEYGHRFRLSKLDAVAAAYKVDPRTLLDWYLESAA